MIKKRLNLSTALKLLLSQMKMSCMQVVKQREKRAPKIKIMEVMDFSARSLAVKIRKTKVMKELNKSGVK